MSDEGKGQTEVSAVEAMARAANRLHHLSMRYSGAIVELIFNQPVDAELLSQGKRELAECPGLRECRDIIDLILFTRAEINAISALLVKAKVFSIEEFTKQAAQEYDWFAQVKAKDLGVGLFDHGITFDVEEKNQGN